MLQTLLQGLKELIFPDNCFLCKKYLRNSHKVQFCEPCLASIQLNHPPFCLNCSRHLKTYTNLGLCTSCLHISHHFDAAWSACLYEKPLTELLHSFKYHGKTHLRKTFSRLMISFIDTYHIPLERFNVITPIPIHSTRFRERGYNQSELLSQMLANHYHIPHKTNIIKRVRMTKPQSSLEAKQRWTNVSDAFRIDSSLEIADKSILIVDDLLTSTATVNAASQSLKNAGAAYVGVLTLSITP